jgi:hypothetical protein
MRRTVIALMVLASAAGAQVVVPTGPVAPATAKAKGAGTELRISGFMISGDRSFNFANTIDTATGSIKGIDVLVRNNGIGLGFRSLTGTFGKQPHVTSADARLYLFPRVFSVMVGAGRRALWSELNATSPAQFDIGIVGISSTIAIGGSGLHTNVAGSYYVPAGTSTDKIKSGMEGEASIMYRFPKLPLFVQAGYRTELFTTKAGTRETPEEVRGVRLGGGLQLGGR